MLVGLGNEDRGQDVGANVVLVYPINILHVFDHNVAILSGVLSRYIKYPHDNHP